MNSCPICSDLMLRHIRQNKIYWFCSCCHQELPNFTSRQRGQLLKVRTVSKLNQLSQHR